MTDPLSSSRSSVWSTLNLMLLCVLIWANHGFTRHQLSPCAGAALASVLPLAELRAIAVSAQSIDFACVRSR